eukprot:TRINITY_DN2223_c0_g1_i2.p1 TRINITY_DN2223_c0_g1~~TRINITY_DN2223_c0_g1_i2.p1  ORF type:complete len:222 (-),score=40.68 TRINITY_DN2223_c0_g1_i2:1184-1849(-)
MSYFPTEGVVSVLPDSHLTRHHLSLLRDERSDTHTFAHALECLTYQLLDVASNYLPTVQSTQRTPTGTGFNSQVLDLDNICAVSVVRAGESMESPVRSVLGRIPIGKILIQRDEETAMPVLMYSKLPPGIEHKVVLVLEPMVATGGSAGSAIGVLKEAGVKEENIIFMSVIISKLGGERLTERFPQMKLVTGAVDPELNEKSYIVPGLGDAGCRYFGTVQH